MKSVLKKFFILILVLSVYFLLLKGYLAKETSALVSGQIMVDPNNASWFVYNKDSDGNGKLDPHFMCALGDPEGFLYKSGSYQTDLINKIKNNDFNGKYANGIYMQIIRSHGGDGTKTHNPFIDNNPSNGLDQNVLNKWESWFTAMDNAGITIYLFFYDDSSKITDWGNYSEDQFYKDIVNEFEHHKNLIWVVAEEYQESFTASKVKSIAQKIRSADDNNHPIAVHKLSGLTFDEFSDDPNIDQFSIQRKTSGADANHDNMVKAWNNANGKYNLNLSEPQNSYGSVTDSRKRAWAVAMGGAYFMQIEWDLSTNGSYFENCAKLVYFFEKTNINEMAPFDELAYSGTKYVLANSNDSYIAYSPSLSGGMGIKNMSSGTYDFLWFDTVSGSEVEQTVSVGSGDNVFTKPSGLGSEIALYIKRSGSSGPTNTPTPSPTTGPSPTPEPNQAPVALDQSVATTIDTPVDIFLQIEDDYAPVSYTYTITQQPTSGTLSGSNNDRIYTPNSGFVGTDSFKWKVNDGQYDSNEATVTIEVRDSLITSLNVNDTNNSSDWSVQTNLQSGDLQYGDRNYTLSTIPFGFTGLEWIRTANDSGKLSIDPLVTFTVNQNLNVYVAVDDRGGKPSWMDSTWSDIGQDIINSESTPKTFSIYQKSYSQGQTVTLGSNSGGSMYTVFVKASFTGDADGDGDVDNNDYLIWESNYGITTSNGSSDGDFDGDGNVDGVDYVIWRSNYTG